MLYDGVQCDFKQIGITGCYFICLCKIAELFTGTAVNINYWFKEFIRRGVMDGKCYIKNAAAILFALTGVHWELQYSNQNPPKQGYTFYIAEYIATIGGVRISHFVITTENENIVFDPYVNSPVVKNGSVVSYRLLKATS